MSAPVVVLGISCFYHDAAAALVVEGVVVAAAQEERFTRIRHDLAFPVNAINYCLEEAGVDPSDLAAVVFYDHPALSADRILDSVVAGLPASREQWRKFAPSLVGQKLFIADLVERCLGPGQKVLFTEHHFSHAASAFYPSPFESAAILTIDGVGEWCTTSLGRGAGETVSLMQEIRYPDSLGLLYSTITALCGFKVNSGEYKLMGLAPYGRPSYTQLFYDHLIDVKPDGSYRLNMEYFGYLSSDRLVTDRLETLFGGPSRRAEDTITKREVDIAASVQQVTEDVVLKLARHARQSTGERRLCLAGGVALNCVANGKIHAEDIFDDVWVQPASGDAGGALGAALHASHAYFGVARPRMGATLDRQSGSFLGPQYSRRETLALINTYGLVAEELGPDRAQVIAGLLRDQQIVGLFQGRMEFGPRALGARSIIADPRTPSMQRDMNLKIKFRESFRPFAPAVLREKLHDYFVFDGDSPYMLMVAPVRPDIRQPFELPEDPGYLMDVLNAPRSKVPAVTHVDFSARIQTVDAVTNPGFYDILKAFDDLTGCAVLINTSFNVRGEPIVCTPKDAYRCFMRSGLDALVIDDFLFRKADQPASADDDSWRSEYELD